MTQWGLHSARRLVLVAVIFSFAYDAAAFTCPSIGSTYETDTEITCFWYLSGYPSTSDAHAQCQAAGGRLAYIPDSATNDFVAAYLTSSGFNGLPSINVKNYYINNAYVYETIEGDPLTYVNWEPGNPIPGEECVAIRPNGKWFDIVCGQTYGGMCSHTTAKDPTERQSMYQVNSGSRLDVNPDASLVVRSRMECALTCEVTTSCIAFNYVPGPGTCELLSQNHVMAASSQVASGTYDYVYNTDTFNS